MRLRPRAVFVLALAVVALGGVVLAVAPGLGHGLPPDTPPRATLDTFERISGDVETAQARVIYELYVEPARNGLYAVTRYQVERKAEAGRPARLESEKYVWNVGRRKRLRCFAREADGSWRALAPETDEYRAEMATTMMVYALHRQATLGR